jgi:hypothetical protein
VHCDACTRSGPIEPALALLMHHPIQRTDKLLPLVEYFEFFSEKIGERLEFFSPIFSAKNR